MLRTEVEKWNRKKEWLQRRNKLQKENKENTEEEKRMRKIMITVKK